MEHCVFCTFLSDGTSYKNCGRPCERHHVQLRDRVGQLHPLLADARVPEHAVQRTRSDGSRLPPGLPPPGSFRFRLELLDDPRKKYAFWCPATGNCWTAPARRPGSSGNWMSRNSSAPRKVRSGPDNVPLNNGQSLFGFPVLTIHVQYFIIL